LRVRIPTVPRWPAAARRRSGSGPARRRPGAPRRALRTSVRALRSAAGPRAPQREVLSLMLRASLLWLSEQPQIFRFVRRNGLAKRFASRFVAGETVESAVAALKDLNGARLSASLDLLGESVLHAEEAVHARDTYLETLDRIH